MDSPTTRQRQLATLATYLRSEAARVTDAPALADQLMDLARQADAATTRPLLTAGQFDTIKATTKALLTLTIALPTARQTTRRLLGLLVTPRRDAERGAFLELTTLFGDELVVLCRSANYTRINSVISAFCLAYELEVARIAAATPPPPPPAYPKTAAQVKQQLTELARMRWRRSAAA